MDIHRPTSTSKKYLRPILLLLVLVVITVIAGATLARLKPAAPSVERSTVWIDKVKRGELLRQVKGQGTLVPEKIQWIPAPVESRIDKILAKPGTIVTANTVLFELSNQELQQAAVDAGYQLQAAETELVNLKVRLQNQLFDQKTGLARVQAEFKQAKIKADADSELAKAGLVSSINKTLSSVTAEELAYRSQVEEQRLIVISESEKAQIDAQRSRIEQLRTLLKLKESQLAALQVKAGIDGVVQQIVVEIGQRVPAGANLAKITSPTLLKAQIKIPEVQAKDIQVGQRAIVDTRNGIIPGRVSRIDPAVQQGTVTIDVKLDGDLPKGVRPDLSVDGAVELEHLSQILYVGRPTSSQEYALIELFKIDNDEKTATRVKVKLGCHSINTTEIQDGLNEGDKIILSDMSGWDGYNTINLK